MKKLLILRPEPGASATAAGARALGLDPVVRPLFTIDPLAWSVPDATGFDALLLTSANALRHAGPGLAQLASLPVLAVGEATAEAARQAGLRVSTTGVSDVQALLDAMPGSRTLLHLAGEQRAEPVSSHHIVSRTVYRAAPVAESDLSGLGGWVVAVHSPRAGARLAELVPDRASTAVAAISQAAASACGEGWQSIEYADRPTDAALLALAARLCQSPAR